jgi:hypothetical protein
MLPAQEVLTGSRETYEGFISGAIKLPVPGLVKGYQTTEYDDFGNKYMVIIKSTEYANEAGELTWWMYRKAR